VSQIIRKAQMASKWVIIPYGGFLVHVIYKSIECLNHINTVHMSHMIFKGVRTILTIQTQEG